MREDSDDSNLVSDEESDEDSGVARDGAHESEVARDVSDETHEELVVARDGAHQSSVKGLESHGAVTGEGCKVEDQLQDDGEEMGIATTANSSNSMSKVYAIYMCLYIIFISTSVDIFNNDCAGNLW